MTQLVFVYGSLKRGFYNHRVIAPAEFVNEARTATPAFRMGNVGRYPEVTRTEDESAGFIRGELFQCDSLQISALDRLEENGVDYLREQVVVRSLESDSSECVESLAWIYLWLKPICRTILPIGYDQGFPVYDWQFNATP